MFNGTSYLTMPASDAILWLDKYNFHINNNYLTNVEQDSMFVKIKVICGQNNEIIGFLKAD